MPTATSTHTASLVPSRPAEALKLPNPSQRPLFLNKLSAASTNGSRVNLHDVTSTPPTPTGLRAQINHLRPKHAYFRARVQIHQISSVPYVSGEFGVKWRFKNVVQNLPGSKQGLLGRVKSRSKRGRSERDADHAFAQSEFGMLSMPDAISSRTVSSSTSGKPPIVSLKTYPPATISHSHSHARQDSLDPTPPSLYASTNANSSRITLSNQTIGTSSSNTNTPATPGTATTHNSFSSIGATPARGHTSFLPLKEHSITWAQTLDTVLKLDVERDSASLQPAPLKLVVMQRVDPDDPPQNPRLGAVYLNLAEYVNQGTVERRYLLRESKTNATLKLTVELTHVGGETTYIPPPLPKGEILTGIANFLESEAYRKRPRALDLYGPYRDQQELEMDLLGAPRRRAARSRSRARGSDSDESDSLENGAAHSDSDDSDDEGEDEGVVFDVARLPVAYGPKTTETLIEAIFNPVRTTEKRRESPFTYYVPPRAADWDKTVRSGGVGMPLRGSVTPRLGNGAGEVQTSKGPAANGAVQPQRHPSTSTTSESVYSTESVSSSSAASVHTTSSSSRGHGGSSVGHARRTSGGNGGGEKEKEELGVKGWWKKMASSRPGTPTGK